MRESVSPKLSLDCTSESALRARIQELASEVTLDIRGSLEHAAPSQLSEGAQRRLNRCLNDALVNDDEPSAIDILKLIGAHGGEEDVVLLRIHLGSEFHQHSTNTVFAMIDALASIGGAEANRLIRQIGIESENEEIKEAASVASAELQVGGNYDLSLGPAQNEQLTSSQILANRQIHASTAAFNGCSGLNDSLHELSVLDEDATERIKKVLHLYS